MSFLIIDIATSGIDGAERYLDDEVISAPSNYRDPQKIAEYIEGKRAERAARLALDLDLCRITAIGYAVVDDRSDGIFSCPTEADERMALQFISEYFANWDYQVITFGGLRFDLPVIMRRCLYHGLPMPSISLDKYRTADVDLYDRLTHHGAVGGHSLQFYVKRLGWTDLVKPLTGEEESRVPQTGRWAELEQSVRHDVVAIRRLAEWLQVLPKRLTVTEPVL